MADRAARWVDTLLPRVAVRQVVVTVPWPRRWLLARKPDLARGVLAIALREVQRWLQRVGTSQRQGQTGSITVVQRFGSALNLNLPPLPTKGHAGSVHPAPCGRVEFGGQSRGLTRRREKRCVPS